MCYCTHVLTLWVWYVITVTTCACFLYDFGLNVYDLPPDLPVAISIMQAIGYRTVTRYRCK